MAERIIEFEGRRISVPLDATDDEVAQILGGGAPPAATSGQPAAGPTVAPPPAAAPAPATPERSLVDTIMAPVAQGLRGAREGVATVLGLPVDAVNNAPRLLNFLPGVEGVGPMVEKPAFGSEHIDNALGLFGLVKEPAAPQNFVERGARRVGKELGAAAVPAGGALAAGAKMGVQGARELPGLARMFVEPAATAPARYVAKETAIATGAGSGAAIANEAVDPHSTGGQVADLIGALTGAGITGLGGMLARGSKNVFDAVRQNPTFQDQVVRDAVTERILEAGGYRGTPQAPVDAEPLIRAIMSPQRQTPAEVIPGYRETVADRTGNPGIAALEYGRQQGAGAGRFVEQRSANAEAVDQVLAGLAPTETPGTFRSALDAERDRRLQDIIFGSRATRQEADDAARAVVPGMADATARGASARSALQDAKDTVKAGVDAAYRPVNEATVPVDVAPLAERFAATTDNLPLNDRNRFLPSEARVPAQLTEPATPPTASPILGPDGQPIMRPGAEASGEVPLREVMSIRSGLADDIRGAQNAGELQRGRVAGQFQGEVNRFLDNAVPEDLRKQLETANSARRDMADRFERPGTALNDILQRQEGGGYATDSSAVTPRLVPTDQGVVTDFRAAMREAGTDPRLRGALADEIVTQAQRAGVMDRPDAMRKFLTDRSIVLEQFPELRDRLGTVASTSERAATAETFQRGVERDLGTDATPGRGPVGRYLAHGDAQSERAIGEVLASKDPAKAADDLVSFVGDNPRALEGARAALWQKLRAEATSAERSMGGKQMWRGDWLKQTLDDPKFGAVAERFYKDQPEQLAALRTYADVLDNADLRTRARTPASSGTSQGVSNILTPETLQSRAYAYMRGQISGTYLATSIAAVVARRAVRAARTDAIERMTDEVLLDPQKAVALLKDNNPANRAALMRKAKGWLGNELSTIVNLAGEDEDQPMKDAIMRGSSHAERLGNR